MAVTSWATLMYWIRRNTVRGLHWAEEQIDIEDSHNLNQNEKMEGRQGSDFHNIHLQTQEQRATDNENSHVFREPLCNGGLARSWLDLRQNNRYSLCFRPGKIIPVAGSILEGLQITFILWNIVNKCTAFQLEMQWQQTLLDCLQHHNKEITSRCMNIRIGSPSPLHIFSLYDSIFQHMTSRKAGHNYIAYSTPNIVHTCVHNHADYLFPYNDQTNTDGNKSC